MPARHALIVRAKGFSNADAVNVASAMQESLRRMWVAWRLHLTPAYQDRAPSVFAWDDDPLPAWDDPDPGLRNISPCYVYDDGEHTDALGYHFVGPSGRPESSVFVGHGSGVATGASSLEETISHELHESDINPHLNRWVKLPGREEWTPLESDDALQEHYTIDLGERRGSAKVSNFCYPAYFGMANHPDVPADQLDQLGTLSSPFELGPAGYRVETDGLNVSYVFGSRRDGFSAAEARDQLRPLARTRRIVERELAQ